MARIPIAEVPNAPQFSGPPQLAQMPDMPTIRAKYQTTKAEPINYRVDMSGEIAALQQKPLPGGFMEGTNRAAEAQKRTAQVGADLAQTINTTMVTATNAISNVVLQAQQKSLQSKDEVDSIRLDQQLKLARPAFEAEMVKRKIPESEWPELWRTEGAPKLMEGTSTLGVTQTSRDKFSAYTNGFIQSTDAHYTLKVAEKSLRNDAELLNGTIKRSLEPGGDLDGGEKANDTALRLQYISKDTHLENKSAFQRGRNNNFANEAITVNPKYVRDQATLALEGKEITEKGFKFLKDDKAAATTVYNAATQEWNRRRGEAQTTILNDVLDGGKPIGSDEITKRGRDAGLDEKDIVALRKAAEVPIAFDPKATSDATSAVENYRNEARSDTDMSRRNAIYNQIITTTSPEIQKLLTGELDGIWKNRNDPGTSQQKELGETYQMIDQYSKSGLLVGRDKEGKEVKLPSGLGTKEGEKTTIVDEKAFQAAEQRRSDLYFDAQTFMKDNPDFKAGELKKFINGKAAPDAQQRADDAPLSGMPAPPRATFHRAEPTPGQVTQWQYGTGTQPTQMQQGAATFPTTGTPTQQEMDERVKERTKAETSSVAPTRADNVAATGGTLTPSLVSNVKKLEGFYAKAYSDYKQHSVGYGTRAKSADETISREEADERLTSELTMHASRVDEAAKKVGLTLTPGQRDALISFDFNTGQGDYLITSSGGDVADIARRIPLYRKAGGKVNQGLVNRRAAEMEMFNA